MTPRDESLEHVFRRSSVPSSPPIQPNARARRGRGSTARESPARAFSVLDWGAQPGWELILGPPGCGKTQTLCARVRVRLEEGVPGDQIVCVSYSRAARFELAGRVSSVCHGLLSGPMQVRTIHSVAFHLLGMSPDRIMGVQHWREFAALNSYQFTRLDDSQHDDDLEYRAPPRGTDDDLLRHAYDWGRNVGLGSDQIPARYQGGLLRVSEFEAFVRRYEAFKDCRGLCDFTDLLEDVLAQDLRPGASVFAIDEAQELSPLLLQVLHLWIRDCEHVYFGADDDQSVHSFQGGDPRWLVQLSKICNVTQLTRSWRVPINVHAVAQPIIRKNKARIPKSYFPTQALGEVLRLPRESIYPLLDGSHSAFVLARNRILLVPIAQELIERLIPFLVEGGGAPSPLSNHKLVAAARTAIEIHRHDGERFAAVSIQMLIEFAPTMRRLLTKELRAALRSAAKAGKILTLEELHNQFALAPLFERISVEGPFSCFEGLPSGNRRYLVGLYARYGTLPEPRIRLTSIHGAKGREADLVVVLPEMAAKSYRQYLANDHEEEHRIFYVAVTRAKHTLVLVEPQGKKHFKFPTTSEVEAYLAGSRTPGDDRGFGDA